METKIKRMQENLTLIRRAIGWSETELANRIGVTRQTINNIESKDGKLSKTQYLAIRAVIDEEIISSINTKDVDMVAFLLEALVDNPEKYSTKERKSIIEKANLLTPALMSRNNSRKEISKEFITLLASVGILGTITVELYRYFLKRKK